MCTGTALARSELPLALVSQHRLAERLYDRDGREEFQFQWWQSPAVLPVRRNGRIEIIPWGSKSRKGPLPYGGWVSQDHVAEGLFAHANPEEVVIPANLGWQAGAWFLIVEGIRGVVVETRSGPVVYMLMEPASNYYRNMTEQSPMMPIFVRQVI
ncbi:MAG: hypothetical protein JWO38_1626 [Gemmataceae bacterium]|nr:hypothetical protein [Gemmataceae bacterium]